MYVYPDDYAHVTSLEPISRGLPSNEYCTIVCSACDTGGKYRAPVIVYETYDTRFYVNIYGDLIYISDEDFLPLADDVFHLDADGNLIVTGDELPGIRLVEGHVVVDT